MKAVSLAFEFCRMGYHRATHLTVGDEQIHPLLLGWRQLSSLPHLQVGFGHFRSRHRLAITHVQNDNATMSLPLLKV